MVMMTTIVTMMVIIGAQSLTLSRSRGGGGGGCNSGRGDFEPE